ncbi:G-protein coupled receptor [Trifolium pratense]|uniref:G-protein coupled receptor n=1 Tax=Trifolium pratense TaxID=57577 RepID=A0A2K3M9Q4_TRIPR|nr:G-protein coupled receptor [Trifolium pratense]
MATSVAVGSTLTAYDRRIINVVNVGASSLSFAGSTFIVLCYLLFKDLRKFSFKLVFYLALSSGGPIAFDSRSESVFDPKSSLGFVLELATVERG